MIDYWLSVSRGAALICALFRLTDRQRYVVVQRHLKGRRHQEIADELGVSRQTISNTEQQALRRLAVVLGPTRRELLV